MMQDGGPLSRRQALQGFGAGLVGATAACGGSSPDPPGSAEPADTPPITTNDPPDASKPSPPDAGADGGPPPELTAADLLGSIDHIVVLMMENRSFDHFLGSLASDTGYPNKAQIDGLKGTESNPAPDGSTVTVFKLDDFTPEDPPHSWDAAHAQFDGGLNDGFVKAHAGDAQNQVMGFHDRSQIPLYYWFADNFTICDRWFASVMGPTWPNRYYLHAATSKGKKDNKPFLTDAPDTIWERLKAKNVTYKNYVAGSVGWYVGGFVANVFSLNPTSPITNFFTAAKNGTLPSFSIIDPDFQASDDHPDHDIQRGQAFVASVYKALAESPAWNKTLLIVTYDEHGGFFDHVPPPKAQDDDPDFQQFGFRVPAFVIGPMVKKGYVSQTQFDHTSVAATVKTRFGIDSLSKRMDTANDLADCIDPDKVRNKAPAPPPTGMPQTAMTLSAALERGVGPSSQPMLEELVERGLASRLDTRPHRERIAEWLGHAERLGAVRIVGPR
ncbi:Acid phosphatase [Labilithrix luteola]|uniref:phospholipase C n=1 Tax=Labilithrix luteola TaxID=1391654 RepID=A0A0K1PY91_9BACT|nr:Acid phosphatase [Labilithrix luteola]